MRAYMKNFLQSLTYKRASGAEVVTWNQLSHRKTFFSLFMPRKHFHEALPLLKIKYREKFDNFASNSCRNIFICITCKVERREMFVNNFFLSIESQSASILSVYFSFYLFSHRISRVSRIICLWEAFFPYLKCSRQL